MHQNQPHLSPLSSVGGQQVLRKLGVRTTRDVGGGGRAAPYVFQPQLNGAIRCSMPQPLPPLPPRQTHAVGRAATSGPPPTGPAFPPVSRVICFFRISGSKWWRHWTTCLRHLRTHAHFEGGVHAVQARNTSRGCSHTHGRLLDITSLQTATPKAPLQPSLLPTPKAPLQPRLLLAASGSSEK